MLSSALHSRRAVCVNIAIMRALPKQIGFHICERSAQYKVH
jgi:hypothetical protein